MFTVLETVLIVFVLLLLVALIIAVKRIFVLKQLFKATGWHEKKCSICGTHYAEAVCGAMNTCGKPTCIVEAHETGIRNDPYEWLDDD